MARKIETADKTKTTKLPPQIPPTYNHKQPQQNHQKKQKNLFPTKFFRIFCSFSKSRSLWWPIKNEKILLLEPTTPSRSPHKNTKTTKMVPNFWKGDGFKLTSAFFFLKGERRRVFFFFFFIFGRLSEKKRKNAGGCVFFYHCFQRRK